jgi:predicted phosphohydrolase
MVQSTILSWLRALRFLLSRECDSLPGMSVWAIADLHLSFGVAGKSMELFGWKDWTGRIERAWRERIGPDDLVLIAGDISWAMRVEEVVPDLQWIERLPGTKVMIRGNHDYWLPSLKKLKEVLPPSIHAIHNTAFEWNGIAVAGTRLWDTHEYAFGAFADVEGVALPEGGGGGESVEEEEKIFVRELGRLEMSLQAMDRKATRRVVMTHYPPIGSDLKPSRASALLEKYRVEACVFGHLHKLRKGPMFGEARGVRYLLTSCDYLDMLPVKVFD